MSSLLLREAPVPQKPRACKTKGSAKSTMRSSLASGATSATSSWASYLTVEPVPVEKLGKPDNAGSLTSVSTPQAKVPTSNPWPLEKGPPATNWCVAASPSLQLVPKKW